MSFQPIIPTGGYTGWRFLTRTLDKQQAAFAKSPRVDNDIDYFRANIGKVKTADDLVGDRRLLNVALGAFGLEDDINSKAFIKKVLADGTTSDRALANRLSDKRYFELASAFRLDGSDASALATTAFSDRIASAYATRSFEAAVGDKDANLRLALGLDRDLGALAASDSKDTTKWFRVLGSRSLREVFQTAFGLPSSFGSLDLDKQVEVLQDRTRQALGSDTISQFASAEKREALVRKFLLRIDINALGASSSPGSAALTLLQSRPSSLFSRGR